MPVPRERLVDRRTGLNAVLSEIGRTGAGSSGEPAARLPESVETCIAEHDSPVGEPVGVAPFARARMKRGGL